ncbi:hypothetical protein IV500_17495 [Paeniglutamicibacter antarcticus]|uniref:Transmembrane protein n=1 Tax=Arthrobacter terrae TaxID=2935737 RepID=A0A931CUH7_9MICC|nr:hypothetical protein [Arthrobacter terrae]MBG0741166.1 hypothetical protein [Arthrobacter terrae]
MENDSVGSLDALSTMNEGHKQAIKRVRSPWWYYPILGIAFAGLELAFALSATLVRTLVIVGVIVVARLAERGYRRVKGTWVGGLRSGKATWLSIGFLLIAVGTIVAGSLLTNNVGQPWPAWIMAMAILFETLIYGFFFDLSIQRKLRPAQS